MAHAIDRVMIEILPLNQRCFGLTDAVSFKVNVKNVQELRVGVYEIDARVEFEVFFFVEI